LVNGVKLDNRAARAREGAPGRRVARCSTSRSMRTRAGLLALLDAGCRVRYFDHHCSRASARRTPSRGHRDAIANGCPAPRRLTLAEILSSPGLLGSVVGDSSAARASRWRGRHCSGPPASSGSRRSASPSTTTPTASDRLPCTSPPRRSRRICSLRRSAGVRDAFSEVPPPRRGLPRRLWRRRATRPRGRRAGVLFVLPDLAWARRSQRHAGQRSRKGLHRTRPRGCVAKDSARKWYLCRRARAAECAISARSFGPAIRHRRRAPQPSRHQPPTGREARSFRLAFEVSFLRASAP